MLYVTKKTREFVRGADVLRKVYDARASAEEAEVIQKVVADWLAGKLEPVRVKEIGYNAAGRRKKRVVIRERKKGSKAITYRYEEEPLTDRDLVQASLWLIHPSGLDYDPQTHEPVKPTVAVVCEDGSAAYVEVPPKLAATLTAPEPEEIVVDEETGAVVETKPVKKSRKG